MFLNKTNIETKVSKKIGNKCKRAKTVNYGKKANLDKKIVENYCHLTLNYGRAGHRTSNLKVYKGHCSVVPLLYHSFSEFFFYLSKLSETIHLDL